MTRASRPAEAGRRSRSLPGARSVSSRAAGGCTGDPPGPFRPPEADRRTRRPRCGAAEPLPPRPRRTAGERAPVPGGRGPEPTRVHGGRCAEPTRAPGGACTEPIPVSGGRCDEPPPGRGGGVVGWGPLSPAEPPPGRLTPSPIRPARHRPRPPAHGPAGAPALGRAPGPARARRDGSPALPLLGARVPAGPTEAPPPLPASRGGARRGTPREGGAPVGTRALGQEPRARPPGGSGAHRRAAAQLPRTPERARGPRTVSGTPAWVRGSRGA
jgi:hypothetical protein